MSASLVIMAAGLGSRYGGSKQVDGIGPPWGNPDGVCRLRRFAGRVQQGGFYHQAGDGGDDGAAMRRQAAGSQTAENGRAVQVAYAFQDFSSLPQFYTLPPERVKPFGTVHALLCAEDVVQEPFCVINADDYYGGGAYRTMYKALDRLPATGKAVMVGYHLKNTASLYGTVSRGVCEAAEGTLRSIRETKPNTAVCRRKPAGPGHRPGAGARTRWYP